MTITGDGLPVASISRHKLRAAGRSVRASTKITSHGGADNKAVGSGDMILIL
jgi:hypothetical protein